MATLVRKVSFAEEDEEEPPVNGSYSADAGHLRRASTSSPSSMSSSEKLKDCCTGLQGQYHRPIFPDPDEMKRKVRQNLTKPLYSVEDFYHTRGLWQQIARHRVFEHATLFVIAANAIWIAYDTDKNEADTFINAKPEFQIVEHFFCIYFSFEWFVRFKAFRIKRHCFLDRWFVFDTVLVFMMVAETWLMTTVLLIFMPDSGGSSPMGNLIVLRLFRLLRLSRMARMLRSFPELMILIKGIGAAMRSVLLVGVLLLIVIYIFAIAFTQLADGTKLQEDYFPGMIGSMKTLVIYGTFLDSLSALCGELRSVSIVYLVLFFIFVIISALTLMNMLIGVLCEVVSAVAATENEMRSVDFVTSKLQGILEQLDADKDHRISRAEFIRILHENDEAVRALDEVGVDPVGIVDFADFIFDEKEDGEDDQYLHFSEFMEVVLKFRGSNTATVKDIVDLRKFVTSAIEHVEYAVNQPDTNMKTTKMSLRRRSADTMSKSTPSTPSKGSVTPQSPTKLSQAFNNQATVQKLQSRVEHMEESIVNLLAEVKQLSERIPPPSWLATHADVETKGEEFSASSSTLAYSAPPVNEAKGVELPHQLLALDEESLYAVSRRIS